MWTTPWIDQARQDLWHAVRRLRRSPAYAITGIGILTVGIALNLAFFQLLNAAALAPLDVAGVDTLVRFDRVTKRFTSNGLPYPATQFIRDHNDVLSAVLTSHASDVVWGDDPNDRLDALYVSANWFAELGHQAALGRLFVDADARADADAVAVVSERFWRNRLDAGPVVGRTIRINDRPALLVGVAPSAFPGLEMDDPQIWLVIDRIDYFNAGLPFKDDWSAHNTKLYGRLKRGVAPAAAMDALRGPIAELARIRPAEFAPDELLQPYSGRDRFRGPRDRAELRTIAAVVGGLSALVLVVACANLSNLVLARAVSRLREFTLCAALGATRWRLFRQHLVESAVFAGIAAAGGLLLGHWAASLAAVQYSWPAYIDFTPDWRVVGAACSIGLTAMLAIGVVPAWIVSRRDLVSTMRDGGHQTAVGLARGQLKSWLAGAQVAGCCVLLIVAATTVRGLLSVTKASFGYEFEHVAALDPSLSRYGIDGESARAFWAETRRVLEATPGIERLALTSVSPMAASANRSIYNDAPRLSVTRTIVEPQFFDVLQIPIVVGRNFEPGDSPGTVAIVSRRLAMEMYGTIDAVGRGFPRSKPERTIVGIAADAPLVNVSGTQVAELYVPIEPRDYGRLVLLARARGTAGGLTQPLIDAARAADPRVLPRTALPAARLGERVQGRRAATLAAGFAGVLASSLACFGIFGIVAYGACRRTQEIGIRRALGAHGRSIVFLLLRQLAMPVAFGVVLGTLAGTAAARMLEGEPFYLPGQDAAVSLAALALFLAVAAAAAVVPAIRALRVDPLAALRQE